MAPNPSTVEWSISKTWKFAASHWLDNMPPNHKCARLHGHNYTFTLRLEGDPDETTGMVVDYAAMDDFADQIRGQFDHQHLGPRDLYLPPLETRTDEGELIAGDLFARAMYEGQPTAENLAASMLGLAIDIFGLMLVHSVTVKETDGTNAVAYA